MPTTDETILLQGPQRWNEYARQRRAQDPFRPDLKAACLHGADLQGVDLVDGGYGYTADAPIERIYRDARSFWFEEGTQEIQQLVVARSVLAAS